MKRPLHFVGDAITNATHNPLIYFIAALFIGVGVNVISARIPESDVVFWIAVAVLGLMMLLISSRWFDPFWLTDRDRNRVVTVKGLTRKFKGLVVFVSVGGGAATARKAIEFHSEELRCVWAFHSVLSLGNADELKREFGSRVKPVPLSDEEFNNPSVIKDRIEEEVFANLPESWTESDVIIDITGATKLATAGAFLAGLPRNRHLQFVPPAQINAAGQGITPAEPLEIDISYTLKPVKRPPAAP